MKTASLTNAILVVAIATTGMVGTSGCSNRPKSTGTKEGESSAVGAVSAAIGAASPGAAGQSATETILAAATPDCLACARTLVPSTGCELKSLACETLAEGQPREQCLDTLRCVLPGGSRPSCVDKTNSNLTSCYCGTASVEACLSPGKANGGCKRVIEVGLGSTDPGFVARSITDPSHPSGVAMKLAQCLADAGRLVDPKCKKCF